MITALRILFVCVLGSMIWVTTWAGLQCPLLGVPRAVATHPWFIATLFDAYWGFMTFYVWVFYKQVSPVARGAWFLAIMALGNIAMSSYCLSELFSIQKGQGLPEILTSRRKGPGLLGIALTAIGIGVLAYSARVVHPSP